MLKKRLWLQQPFPLKWNSGDLSVRFMLFWFDAHCSSSGIKGTVVGMIFPPSPAFLLLRHSSIHSVCPSHTWAHTLYHNSQWGVCVCVFKRRLELVSVVWVCARMGVLQRVCRVHHWDGPTHFGSCLMYTHIYTHSLVWRDFLWLSGELTWPAGGLAECRTAGWPWRGAAKKRCCSPCLPRSGSVGTVPP